MNEPRYPAHGGPMQAAELALPGKRASRAAFERAAMSFDDACVVHDWARERLLERLELMRVGSGAIVDLGCATGRSANALARRFPAARILSLDSSFAMLKSARAAGAALTVAGDAERLPLPSASIALLFANLVLPWCRPDLLFREAARVLEPGAPFMFATFGPDTLAEVRRAWPRDDDRIHVHAAFDMHDLGDLATAARLQEPVLDVERIELTYAEVGALVRDLRACGGVNTAPGRRRSLTAPSRWRAFTQALDTTKRQGRFSVTVELIFGQAWGASQQRSREPDPGEIVVPLDRVMRRGT